MLFRSSWTFTSDQRDKTDIQPLPLGRDFLRDVKPRKFTWNHRHTTTDNGKEAIGFIAQEVLETVEEFNVPYTNLVDTNDPEHYTLGATNLIPILVKAIQELDTELSGVNTELAQVKQENQDLKTRLEALENKLK